VHGFIYIQRFRNPSLLSRDSEFQLYSEMHSAQFQYVAVHSFSFNNRHTRERLRDGSH